MPLRILLATYLCCGGPSGGAFSLASEQTPASQQVDFGHDILPIFQSRCWGCHGADEQQGELRLDKSHFFQQGGRSGPVIQPGQSAASLLLQRITSSEARMPLDQTPLTRGQIDHLRRWIEQGAHWPTNLDNTGDPKSTHWAYAVPVRPALPDAQHDDWPQNGIDSLVLAKLENHVLAPSRKAKKSRLLRRLCFDLNGLPPRLSVVDEFLADQRPDHVARQVDRLLASPAYGEKWTRTWLDAARYADSNGYQADQFRSVWPFRDWVIDALNADMPFDQFTLEQLAGDLLPTPSLPQQIATGFHRLTTCNVEAGVDPEENRTNQVLERVNTTGTLWLGTSLACCQCHSHKYDPFTQQEYYQFFAFFNNTPLEVSGEGVQREFDGPKLELPLARHRAQALEHLQLSKTDLEKTLAEHSQTLEQQQATWEATLRKTLNTPVAPDKPGKTSVTQPLPTKIADVLAIARPERNPQQSKQLRKFYFDQDKTILKLRAQLQTVQQQIAANQPDTTLVMIEQPSPRSNAVFVRGNFLDRGKEVVAATPQVLHAWDPTWPQNRFGLAQWITSPANPLTARVVVNRWWSEFFGRGIVKTVDDFGTQGAPPSHPQLLDFLATELLQAAYSQKHLHRAIVSSATYQQSSRMSSRLLSEDPENKFYARGPRQRLPAEMIRDNALAISGLLVQKMHGAPIYPPQPQNIWRHVGRNAPKYEISSGEDRYRRGLYVVWRRSAPYPSFTTFDAPDRTSCVVQRASTNTPLQALVLLNDSTYVEMAFALAQRILNSGTDTTTVEKACFGFRLCLARHPEEKEIHQLVHFFEQQRSRLRADSDAVTELTQHRKFGGFDPVELSAWFFIAHTLLNLDETITK